MSEEHGPEFEDRLRMLLARTAKAIPADTDIAPRVQQAAGQVRSASSTAGPRTMLAAVAAALVVALLASVLLFVRPVGPLRPPSGVIAKSTSTAVALPKPRGSPPACNSASLGNQPPPPATAIDHSVAVGQSASVNGITITIDRAYADATQTIITYHMQTTINPPSLVEPVLIDAHGQRYGSFFGGLAIHDWVIAFTPLPRTELGTPQTLTFFTQQMQLTDATGQDSTMDGPWQITFSLIPEAGTSYALSNVPVTRGGVTVQPLRVDVAPAGGGLDVVTGGARVIVRVSGLAPDVPLLDLHGFDYNMDLAVGGMCGSGSGVLELVLPNGQPITPGFVYPLGLTVPITSTEREAASAQTVGPSGAVELAALFFMPIPSVSSLILYMDQLDVQIAGAAKPENVSGPWEFRLQPSA